MPWTSELAQLPTPAIATLTLLTFWCLLVRLVRLARFGPPAPLALRPGGRCRSSGDLLGRAVRCGRRLLLGFDQVVEPADVVLQGVCRVLDDGARVRVQCAARSRGPELCEALGELRPAPLQQGEARRPGEVPREGEAEPEAPRVVSGGRAGQELGEELPPRLGDAVHLAGTPPPRAPGRAPTGPQDRELPAQRAGRGDRLERWLRRGRGLDRLDGPGGLEAGDGGVERPEGHVGEQAEPLAQLPADLVAVQRAPLFEEAEDREVEHQVTISARYSGAPDWWWPWPPTSLGARGGGCGASAGSEGAATVTAQPQ